MVNNQEVVDFDTLNFVIDVPVAFNTKTGEVVDILSSNSNAYSLTGTNGETIDGCNEIIAQGASAESVVENLSSLVSAFEPLKFGFSPRSTDITYRRIQCTPNRKLKSKTQTMNSGNYFTVGTF